MTTTHMLFQASEAEKNLIQLAARGNQDAVYDLEEYHNIVYREKQGGWVRDTSLQDLKDTCVNAFPNPTGVALKFRVWDQSSRAFVNDPSCFLGRDGSLWIGGLKQNTQDPRYIVERFTGQIDKHGNEVYVGDIIFCTYSWWWRQIEETHQVEMDSYQRTLPFHWLFAYGHEIWIELLRPHIAVIGNIHEHPEKISLEHGHRHAWKDLL